MPLFGRKPVDVKRVKAKLQKQNKVTLRWNKTASKEYKITVLRSDEEEFEDEVCSRHRYKYKCLKTGTYKFHVKVSESLQPAARSNAICTDPYEVTNLRTEESCFGVIVKWDDLGARTYNVEVFRKRTFSESFIARLTVEGTTEYIIPSEHFAADKVFAIRVWATNTEGRISKGATTTIKCKRNLKTEMQVFFLNKGLELIVAFVRTSVKEEDAQKDYPQFHILPNSGLFYIERNKQYTSLIKPVSHEVSTGISKDLLVGEILKNEKQYQSFDLGSLAASDDFVYALECDGEEIKRLPITIKKVSFDLYIYILIKGKDVVAINCNNAKNAKEKADEFCKNGFDLVTVCPFDMKLEARKFFLGSVRSRNDNIMVTPSSSEVGQEIVSGDPVVLNFICDVSGDDAIMTYEVKQDKHFKAFPFTVKYHGSKLPDRGTNALMHNEGTVGKITVHGCVDVGAGKRVKTANSVNSSPRSSSSDNMSVGN